MNIRDNAYVIFCVFANIYRVDDSSAPDQENQLAYTFFSVQPDILIVIVVLAFVDHTNVQFLSHIFITIRIDLKLSSWRQPKNFTAGN